MSGSRLARSRIGRLALLGCGVLCIVFLALFYQSTSDEMTKLKDLHLKCAQQQEALTAQLQVIYEYKVQLEKTLSNEKSSNAAAKEELQQKASRERSLCDKNNVEAMQRYNALQQNFKLLKTEHQDLKEDCKKKADVALENVKRLETTAQDLRIQLKKSTEEKERSIDDKEKAMEHLKNKHIELLHDKEELEEKLNVLKKASGDSSGTVERLQKQVMQLRHELDEVRKSPHFSVGAVQVDDSQLLLRRSSTSNNNNEYNDKEKSLGLEGNQVQMARPSSQQQPNPSSKSQSVAAIKSPPENSQQKSSSTSMQPRINKAPTIVKLPEGVPPIPRLIPEPKNDDDNEVEKKRLQESAGQAPPPLKAAGDSEVQLAKNNEDAALRARHLGDDSNRREPDGWFKMKPGVQEVGEPHRVDKNGFENAGGNEDVEQYDDYNYKDSHQNKNGDLHLEEGEDEREDEDDYMHNNVNEDKHE